MTPRNALPRSATAATPPTCRWADLLGGKGLGWRFGYGRAGRWAAQHGGPGPGCLVPHLVLLEERQVGCAGLRLLEEDQAGFLGELRLQTCTETHGASRRYAGD